MVLLYLPHRFTQRQIKGKGEKRSINIDISCFATYYSVDNTGHFSSWVPLQKQEKKLKVDVFNGGGLERCREQVIRQKNKKKRQSESLNTIIFMSFSLSKCIVTNTLKKLFPYN